MIKATRSNKWQFIKGLVKSPVFVILVISILVLSIQIIIIGKYRPFNSDDLYWQLVIRTWRPFSGNTLYLATKDIFVELLPFFIVMEALFEPSRKLLIFETLIITCSSFVLFYGASLYFINKLKIKISYITLLPFVWLASFGFPIVQNYLNTNWRTLEVGISFATFAYIAAIFNGDIKPLKSRLSLVTSLLITIFTGIMIYSDPYFIYFTIAPMAIFTIGIYMLKKIQRQNLIIVLAGTFLSFIFAKLMELLFSKAGVYIITDAPSAFVSHNNILTNIVDSTYGLLTIFNADFLGRATHDFYTIVALTNAAILGVVVYKVFGLRNILKRPGIHRLSLEQLWTVFFGCMTIFVFLVYTSSTLVTAFNYRFFIMLVYFAVIFLSIVISITKNAYASKIVTVTIVLASLFNIYVTIGPKVFKSQAEVSNNIGNSLNLEVIKAIKKEGLTKGYTNYWQGNVNTYLSNKDVTFLASLCREDNKTYRFVWLADEDRYNLKTNRTFYFIDNDTAPPHSCSEEYIKKQLGEPEKIIYVRGKPILIYNYDISNRIPAD